jgi:hypothetical protein
MELGWAISRGLRRTSDNSEDFGNCLHINP